MTHLNIQQGLNVEVVSTLIIKKLYDAAQSVPLPEEGEQDLANMSGNLLVDKTYRAQVSYLTTRFPNLHINVTDSYYVPFEDSNVLSVLMANNISPDGIGITETDASTANLGTIFKNNTAITSFNEFGYFTRANDNPANNMFEGCSSLAQIDLSNITKLGDRLFFGTGITTVNMPNLLVLSGDELFYGCSNLTSVQNLGTITSFSNTMFTDCSHLESVILPATITTLPVNNFSRCYRLKTINLQNISTIGNNGLRETLLTDVNINDLLNLVSVGEYAFLLTRISGILNLPKLTTIGSLAFDRCSLITGIECLGKLSTISNSRVFYGTGVTYVKLPYECTTIGNSAFEECSNLTSIKQYTDSIDNWVEGVEPTTGPLSRVTLFGTNCFKGCSLLLLTQQDIQNATAIGKSAFYGTLLSGPIDLSNVSSIDEASFRYTKITSVNLGNNITSLPRECFESCSNLSYIYGLENVTHIGSYFANDGGLFSSMDVLHFDNATSCDSAITNWDSWHLSYPCHMYFPKLTTMPGSYSSGSQYHNGFFTERGGFGCSFVYFRDISVVKPGTFSFAHIKSFVINNTTPPSVTGIDANNTGKLLDRIFHYSQIENIYVPDASISAYQNSDFLSSYLLNGYTKNNVLVYPQLRGMSELTHYATEADWVTAGKPVDGIIDAYM